MKKIYFLLLALVSIAFIGCEEKPTPEPEPQPTPGEYSFTLTSEGAINFDNNGGIGRITYNLVNPTETGVVTCTPDVDWIINVNTSEAGAITFTAKRNQTNESRTTMLVAHYEDQSIEVMVNQRSNNEIDVSNVATNATGFYYGDYSAAGGDFNYYLILTNGEMIFQGTFEDPIYGTYDSYSYTSPNAYYYFIDLYAEMADDGSLRVPDGTYTFDKSASGQGGHFMPGHSLYQLNDEGGFSSEQYLMYEGSTLVVEGDKIELTAVLVNDDLMEVARHFVSYTGEYQLVDNHR